MKAIVDNGAVLRVIRPGQSFTDKAGNQHPANVLDLWSAAELATLGVMPVTPAEVPDGKQSAGPSTFKLETDELTGATVVREMVQLEDAPPPPVKPQPLADDVDMKTLLGRLRALGLAV